MEVPQMRRAHLRPHESVPVLRGRGALTRPTARAECPLDVRVPRTMRYASKHAFVRTIREEHDALCAQLDRIPKSRHREPGVWGDGWSVSDLIAHLAEWQTMCLRWYEEGRRGAIPGMPAPGYKWSETPRLNHDIWAKHRLRSPAAIRAEFEEGYRRILGIVGRLSAEELLEPGQFAWTGNCPLTTYLGANSASHYRFANKVLKRWLKGVRRSASPGSASRVQVHRRSL